MHVSIHGSFNFILTSINRHSMSPNKWLEPLLVFNKEISMLILQILPTEMNESLVFHHPLLPCKHTSSIPGPLPANLALFFGSAIINLASTQITQIWLSWKNKQKLPGPLIPTHLHSFQAKGQRVPELVQPVRPSIRRPLSTGAVFFCLWTCQHLVL